MGTGFTSLMLSPLVWLSACYVDSCIHSIRHQTHKDVQSVVETLLLIGFRTISSDCPIETDKNSSEYLEKTFHIEYCFNMLLVIIFYRIFSIIGISTILNCVSFRLQTDQIYIRHYKIIIESNLAGLNCESAPVLCLEIG